MYRIVIIFNWGSNFYEDDFDTVEQAEDRAAELRAAGYMVKIEEA